MFAQQYSDFHKLIWICSIIGALGGGAGVFIGALKWTGAVWTKICAAVTHLSMIQEVAVKSDETQKQIADMKSVVDLIQTNHLNHLQSGITMLTEQGEKQIELLGTIDKGIGILVDRGNRA